MTKILIVGIGGVGGYLAGMLSNKYTSESEVEIILKARGEHLKAIQENGLKLFNGEVEIISAPKAIENTNDIADVDYVLLCTKSYDLVESLEQIKNCVSNRTVIIPFLNGVEALDICKKIYPTSVLANGCVYIVSYIQSPGVIFNADNIQKFTMGMDGVQSKKLTQLHELMVDAGIDIILSSYMESILWEKFHLVGANSTATTFFNCTVGQILEDAEKRNFLEELLHEINALSQMKGIDVSEEFVYATLEKLAALPYDTTSSLQRDYVKSKECSELETITGYVVREAKKIGFPTPAFNEAYAKLSN